MPLAARIGNLFKNISLRYLHQITEVCVHVLVMPASKALALTDYVVKYQAQQVM